MKNGKSTAIDKKINFRMGILCMVYLFYMMFGFGTICVQGYVLYDDYKSILLISGATVFAVLSIILLLPKLDSMGNKKFKIGIIDALFAGAVVTWLIGTLASVDRHAAFLGDDYRKTGFFFMGLILITGYIVSKFAIYHFALSIGFAVWTIITNIVGIMQYYQHDPFNWQIYRQFTGLRSMFGNSNQYSAMCAVFLSVLLVIFILEKNIPTLIITGIAIVVDMVAGLSSSSAGFYFVLFAILVAIGFALRNPTWLRRLWMVAVMMYAGLLIQRRYYNTTDDWNTHMNEEITKWIFANNKLIIGAAIAIVILGIVVFLAKPLVEKFGTWMSRVWFILFGVLILTFVGAFIYANKNGASIPEEAFLHKIVITEHWGSGRAEIWKEVLRVFGEGSLKDKLFGIGFNNISRLNLLSEILGGQTLADAHNVYLDMLLTCGILGAGLYFATIIAMIVRAAKYAKKCPGAMLACVMAATYLGVAFIDFNMNIFFPTCFMVMAYGLSFTKDMPIKEENTETVSE